MAQQPRITADQGVPVVQQPRQSPVQAPIEIATAPNEALARFGETVSSIGKDLLENRIRLQRTTLYNQKSTEAHLSIDEFTRANERYPYDFADPEQADAYQKATAAGVDKIVSDTLAKVKDPEVRAQLSVDLGKNRENAIIRSRAFATAQTIDAGKAQFVRSLDYDVGRAADASSRVEFSDRVETAMARINNSGNLFTEEQKYKLGQETLSRIEMIRTDRTIETNPVAALHELTDESLTGHMDPVDRQQLVNKAINAVHAQEADAVRQMKADEVAADKNFKAAQDQMVTDMMQMASRGELRTEFLYSTAGAWGIDPSEIRSLETAIERGPIESSDRGTRNDAFIRAFAVNPTITRSELNQKLSSGKLAVGDWTQATRQLEETESQQRSAPGSVNDRVRQAEKKIDNSMGFVSDFQVLDDDQKTALALAREDFHENVRGGAAPELAADEALKRYLPLVDLNLKARVKAVAISVAGSAVTATEPLQQIEQAKQWLIRNQQRFDKATYNKMTDQLLDAAKMANSRVVRQVEQFDRTK